MDEGTALVGHIASDAKVYAVMASARCVVFDRRSPSACGLGPKHPKCMVVALRDAGYDIVSGIPAEFAEYCVGDG